MSKFIDPTYETGGNVTVRCKCGALIGVTVRQLDSGHTLVTRRCVRCLDYVPLGNADESNQDEQILAAIIAGGMASGRRVAPALNGYRFGQVGHGCGYGISVPSGPVCAVGAGVLFCGISKTSRDPLEYFAKIHRVPYQYAAAVSDAFEGESAITDERGCSVGSAAYDFFCGGDE